MNNRRSSRRPISRPPLPRVAAVRIVGGRIGLDRYPFVPLARVADVCAGSRWTARVGSLKLPLQALAAKTAGGGYEGGCIFNDVIAHVKRREECLTWTAIANTWSGNDVVYGPSRSQRFRIRRGERRGEM